jgi:hypothetical protein
MCKASLSRATVGELSVSPRRAVDESGGNIIKVMCSEDFETNVQ